eukprot:m.17169 g.17169  ORF g.17169 m.17169 type:complete len:617 (+) comp27347_c0_seq2:91-1941(+)
MDPWSPLNPFKDDFSSLDAATLAALPTKEAAPSPCMASSPFETAKTVSRPFESTRNWTTFEENSSPIEWRLNSSSPDGGPTAISSFPFSTVNLSSNGFEDTTVSSPPAKTPAIVNDDDDETATSPTPSKNTSVKVTWERFEDADDLELQSAAIATPASEWKVYCKLRRAKKKDPWQPVWINLRDSTLTLAKCTEDDILASFDEPPPVSSGLEEVPLNEMHPFHEVQLIHEMAFTPIAVRKTGKGWKCHSVKLRYYEYKEKRSVLSFFQREHLKKYVTLLKLVSDDPFTLSHLVDSVTQKIRHLPVNAFTDDPTCVYRINEIFVDFQETCNVEARWNGKPISQKSSDRIQIRAFLSRSPECRLILNDHKADELQSANGFLPPGRAVLLHDVTLHPCADCDAFDTKRSIKFRPLNAVNFELLRCKTKPLCPPPLTASIQMKIEKSHVSICVTLEKGKTTSAALHFRNVVVKIPMPSTWTCLFVKMTRLGKKSVKSFRRLGVRRSLGTDVCQIQASVGRAKYEPEFGALTWRIGRVAGPFLEPNDKPVMTCQLQLPQDMYRPDVQSLAVEMEYDVPMFMASDMRIRALRVHTLNRHRPERRPAKYVKYNTHYHHVLTSK